MRRLLIGIGVIASLTGSWWGAAEAQAAQGGPRYSVGTTPGDLLLRIDESGVAQAMRMERTLAPVSAVVARTLIAPYRRVPSTKSPIEVPPVAVPLPMLDPEPSVVPGVGAS